MANKSICLIGKDARMEELAQLFYAAGYDICSSLVQAVSGDILIIPPNLFELPECEVCFERIYGGKQKNDVYPANYFNYADVPSFTRANAKITADGILDIAAADKVKYRDVAAIVVGFGYCGREIAARLKEKNADVYVMVRRPELKKSISELGYHYIDMRDADREVLQGAAVIFNTVPALVLGEDMLKNINADVRIYDIASAPGGVDFGYCREHGIKADIYLGIPGKLYPAAAAQAIYDTIINDIACLTS